MPHDPSLACLPWKDSQRKALLARPHEHCHVCACACASACPPPPEAGRRPAAPRTVPTIGQSTHALRTGAPQRRHLRRIMKAQKFGLSNREEGPAGCLTRPHTPMRCASDVQRAVGAIIDEAPARAPTCLPATMRPARRAWAAPAEPLPRAVLAEPRCRGPASAAPASPVMAGKAADRVVYEQWWLRA